MENKRKNIYITIFVITTIVAACIAVYFAIIGNSKNEDMQKQVADLKQEIEDLKNESKQDVKIEIDTEKESVPESKNEAKELIISDEDKIKYNKILKDTDNTAILQIMIACNNSGEFNDQAKLNFSTFVASKKDKENFESNVRMYENGGPLRYINKEYINKYSKKIFGESINFANISNEINDSEVIVSFPTGLGIYIFKIKSLVLNEITDEYTMTFDNVYPPDYSNENIQEYIQETKLDYDKSCVEETYVLKYKNVDGNNILLSLDRTYKK